MRDLVLASTSPFRRELLERLGLPFHTAAPAVDEQRLPDEDAVALVTRLAHAKAQAVASTWPEALIIGSDQVALNGDEILGKPGDHATAVRQLQAASGRAITFHTGLCLLNAATGHSQVIDAPYRVWFRDLSDSQIEHYLQREQPYNCAGSFKSEGLGIALFDQLEGEDPNALIGLPLIRLIRMLEAEGVAVL